jgi:hypothetical protein
VATSEKTDRIMVAVMAVQKACPKIKKDAKAEIASRKGAASSFGYRYVSREEAWDKLMELLHEQGLVPIQMGREGHGGSRWLDTRIVHTESEQWIEGSYPIEAVQGGMQALGSGSSYAARQGLLLLLHVVPVDEDDDGKKASTAQEPRRQTQAARPIGHEDDPNDRVLKAIETLPGIHSMDTLKALSRDIDVDFKAARPETQVRCRAAFKAATARIGDKAKDQGPPS